MCAGVPACSQGHYKSLGLEKEKAAMLVAVAGLRAGRARGVG